MATSGTATFNSTRNEIIAGALRLLTVIRAGETAGSQLIADGARRLNGMVKRWQGSGIHVWTVTEATLFPQPRQIRYGMGIGATDHITRSYVETTLSADEATGQSILSVTDPTLFVSGNTVGVVIDDGTIHWTTVNGAPGPSTVTITTPLPDSASQGAKVYAYGQKITRPLKIVDSRRLNVDTGLESPMRPPMARLEYQGLPNKSQPGPINGLFYDPQLTIGYAYLWQAPVAINELIKFTYWRPIEDFNAAGDNPDMPQEWIDAIEYNLALQWAPEFSVPMETFNQIAALAAGMLDGVANFDREAESVHFGIELGP